MAIAVGEQEIKFVKTDAPLYNGQPTDTGTQCHSYIQHALHSKSNDEDLNANHMTHNKGCRNYIKNRIPWV